MLPNRGPDLSNFFADLSKPAATGLFTRLKSPDWSQQGFDSSVSAEIVIFEASVKIGEIGWCYSAVVFCRKGIV